MLKPETIHDVTEFIKEIGNKYSNEIVNYDKIREELWEYLRRSTTNPNPQDRTLEQLLVIEAFRINLSKKLRRAVTADEATFSYLNSKLAVKFAKEFDERGIRNYCKLYEKLIPHQHNPYKIGDDELKRYIFAKKKKCAKRKIVSLDSDDISRYVFEGK